MGGIIKKHGSRLRDAETGSPILPALGEKFAPLLTKDLLNNTLLKPKFNFGKQLKIRIDKYCLEKLHY